MTDVVHRALGVALVHHELEHDALRRELEWCRMGAEDARARHLAYVAQHDRGAAERTEEIDWLEGGMRTARDLLSTLLVRDYDSTGAH